MMGFTKTEKWSVRCVFCGVALPLSYPSLAAAMEDAVHRCGFTVTRGLCGDPSEEAFDVMCVCTKSACRTRLFEVFDLAQEEGPPLPPEKGPPRGGSNVMPPPASEKMVPCEWCKRPAEMCCPRYDAASGQRSNA